MPTIDEVMAGIAKSALTRIAVGVGPGPYTGLRVGVMTALTLGHVLDIPVVGLCSLDAIAAAVPVDGPFLVASDARRKEVYWAVYEGGVRGAAPAVSAPAELPPGVRSLPTAGRGPLLYPEWFPAPIRPIDVDAGWLATEVERRLAAGEPTDPVRPLYLRQPDAQPAAGVKSVLP